MENNWNIEQTKKLFGYAHEAAKLGKGLMWAFLKTSGESGRSVNSVRNYYYSQLKMFELVPKLAQDLGITLVTKERGQFELFKTEEICDLIEKILIGKASGVSVRATIAHLSGGDQKQALRLQNKYRSMITHHKSRVNNVMNNLAQQNIPYFNPYSKTVVTDGASQDDNYKKLTDYIASLDESEVDNFFTLMRKLFA
ncbi:MAG: hypothetical protein FWH03_02205 [Firmicutes bacterium]|nr:hypothetical protein [Bacillota bacterium]